ncbi:MAG: response regulator [Saprospiraceae bacterium]|nr:MAG: response regulator [Saprospiraceae bacterium]
MPSIPHEFSETRPVNILLIEDNPGDVRLAEEAFKECDIKVQLHVVMDGLEAIKFLKKNGSYASSPTPDLILLDLNLPKKDGREVLEEIKGDPELRIIPVVVLTTSNAHQDIMRCYHLHVNSYINKPVDFDRFFEIIRNIEGFWLKTAVLPTLVT